MLISHLFEPFLLKCLAGFKRNSTSKNSYYVRRCRQKIFSRLIYVLNTDEERYNFIRV